LKRDAEELAQKQGVSLNQFILWSVAEKVGVLKHALDDPNFPGITYRRGTSGIPTPVLRGTGIRVQTVVAAGRAWGLSLSEIADQYGQPESRVKEAMGYYKAHRMEIDAAIASEATLESDHGKTTAASGC
jgi:uncharacterized protein (DUF433 family)